MEKSSFREILARFLEEKADISPREATKSVPHNVHLGDFSTPFHWQAPELKSAKKNGYPPPPPRKVDAFRGEKPTAKAVEQLIATAKLETIDQACVQRLVRMGAHELTNRISLIRLKKAHRRLAKVFHPDHLDKGLSPSERENLQARFLALQAAYEQLSRSLPRYPINDSTCGSESASAPGSPRQDAA